MVKDIIVPLDWDKTYCFVDVDEAINFRDGGIDQSCLLGVCQELPSGFRVSNRRHNTRRRQVCQEGGAELQVCLLVIRDFRHKVLSSDKIFNVVSRDIAEFVERALGG